MKLHVIAVGRLKAEFARTGCADFFGRVGHHFSLQLHEVRDAHRRGGQAARWKAAEAEALRAAVPAGARVVALDERGRQWSSRGFAEWLGRQRDEGAAAVAFVIGGPDGLDPTLRDSADEVWALGKLTMSHELARLVLAEQLYRAAAILDGLPYHRD
ncbi:MAG: 23S rRNA (pseudouridine(1915)-N(3))-methyltransferase RlmH [Myxococcales bacterium]|nr:23S rRNA (pseudouridine(1915)-N(3))-methyltransferase RlmH [Myxococcales bacterium]